MRVKKNNLQLTGRINSVRTELIGCVVEQATEAFRVVFNATGPKLETSRATEARRVVFIILNLHLERCLQVLGQ